MGCAFLSLGCFALQPFRGQIQQPEGFIAQMSKCLLSPDGIQARVQTSRSDPATLQLQHLIFHQCHQR